MMRRKQGDSRSANRQKYNTRMFRTHSGSESRLRLLEILARCHGRPREEWPTTSDLYQHLGFIFDDTREDYSRENFRTWFKKTVIDYHLHGGAYGWPKVIAWIEGTDSFIEADEETGWFKDIQGCNLRFSLSEPYQRGIDRSNARDLLVPLEGLSQSMARTRMPWGNLLGCHVRQLSNLTSDAGKNYLHDAHPRTGRKLVNLMVHKVDGQPVIRDADGAMERLERHMDLARESHMTGRKVRITYANRLGQVNEPVLLDISSITTASKNGSVYLHGAVPDRSNPADLKRLSSGRPKIMSYKADRILSMAPTSISTQLKDLELADMQDHCRRNDGVWLVEPGEEFDAIIRVSRGYASYMEESLPFARARLLEAEEVEALGQPADAILYRLTETNLVHLSNEIRKSAGYMILVEPAEMVAGIADTLVKALEAIRLGVPLEEKPKPRGHQRQHNLPESNPDMLMMVVHTDFMGR